MADVGLKIQILHKSISTFSIWLDGCDKLLADLPSELLTCPPSMLRELALKYKDLRLQIQERCTYIQEVNSLCSEIGEETSTVSPEDDDQSSRTSELAKLATDVRDLNNRFATTCVQAKQHYADLSNAIGGDRPLSSLSGQGISSSLPPRPSSKSSSKSRKSRAEKRKLRKKTQSLCIEEDQSDGQPAQKSDTGSLQESSQLKKSQSWSLPTDLDDMIKQQSMRETSESHDNGMGGGSNNDQQNPSTAPSKQETQDANSSFSSPTKTPRPRLDHCESLDSSRRASGSFERDHSPSSSLRGSIRVKRPKSAVIVSGDSAQFCYLDERGSPISSSLSNSPVLKVSSDKAHSPPGKPATLKLEAAPRTSQRSSVTSFGDVLSLTPSEDYRPHQLVDDRRMSVDQNASLLSSGSSSRGTAGGEGGPRLSKSMDELVSAGTADQESKSQHLTSRLRELSSQLQDFVHSIAESRKCSLQSLAMELHLGEVKAMLTILEVQDTEMTRLRATFSPLAKRRLDEMKSLKTVSNSTTFSREQIAEKREEILKLSERVGILRRHCKDAVEQYEEVLELVVQYEKQFKILKDFLTDHTSTVEAIKERMKDEPDETWRELSEELTTVSEEKPQLKCIHELSVHLLYLEPIFDGSHVREDLKGLTEKFQQLTLKIFSLLEEQAKLRAEGLLMESSVMSSWITEAGLSVQALAKKTKKPLANKSKLAATKETLTQELYKHQSALEVISDKLQPILAVLNSGDTPSLDELVQQIETNGKSLEQIEANLLDLNIGLSQDSIPTGFETELPRSKTISEGMRRHGETQALSVGGHIKQRSEIVPPSDSRGQQDDNYAEIGNLRAEILGGRASVGSSKVPGPNLRGDLRRASDFGPRVQRASLHEKLELPSPLAEFDHAPSRLLDNAIEMLPQTSPVPSLPHTPSHSTSALPHTPTRRPNGRVEVQYVEINVSQDQNSNRKPNQPKSSSFSSLDRLQNRELPDPTYAEIDKRDKKFADYAEINKFKRNFTSSPDLSSRSGPKYAEIEVKNLSELASGDKYAEIEMRPEPVEDLNEEKFKKKVGGRLRKRKLSLHEELLEFIGEEWAEISLKKTIHQAVLDEAALDQSLSSIENGELRGTCQRFVRGVREVEAGVQGVVEQISLLKPPSSPDLERVHSAIDQCQKLLDRLNKLHPRLDSYNNESLSLIASLGRSPACARVAQLIEIRLFEVSTLWYSTNLKASTHMQELRSQEGDINYLYRQLQQLSRVLKEGSSLVAQKDTVTNVDDYLASCKAMYSKLADHSELRKQVHSDIKETVSQTTQTAITKELVEQMKEVSSQWKSVTKQLQKMPTVEHILIQLSLANTSADLTTMETAYKTMEVRSLRVEEAATNCATCKAQLEKARLLRSSLASIEAKLFAASGDQGGVEASSGGEDRVDGEQSKGVGLDSERSKAMLVQCKELLERLDSTFTKMEKLSIQLQDESELIVQFQSELNDLQLWMSDTLSMLHLSVVEGPNSVTQLRGKHQAIFQQIVTRQPKLTSVRSLAEKLVLLPSSQSEKQLVESQLNDVCSMWDNLCKQIVPAGSLPQVMTPMTTSGRRLQFEPPTEFEDIQQMVDWLTMLDFKLQPKTIIVGDVKQIRRCLQDLQMIASEVRSREADYNKFVDGGGIPTSLCTDSLPPDFDPELSSIARSMLGDTTPDGIYQIPPKFVKFYDESTLERHQRRQEISTVNTENGNPETDTDGEAGQLDKSLANHGGTGEQRNGVDIKSRSGMELKLDGLELGQPPRRLLSEFSRDEEFSLSSLSSQLLSPTLNEDVYQLFLLWKSIWVSLSQQQKRLESTLEVWKNFEVMKEKFCDFLFEAEQRVGGFFKTLSECKDLNVVQTEIAKQQAMYSETPRHSQQLATLNHLADDLIANRHSNDDTSDLQDMMADLNKRWEKVTESVSQHQSTVASMAARWAEFYREYQSFQQWIHKLDTDMSNINPFIGNLGSVRIQLQKMKEIQQELHSREGGVESIRMLAYKLLQGVGGCHINTAAVHSRLDSQGRRLKQLEILSQERRTDLENALTEKQDFVSHLADALSWLSQAEKHLSSQKPLGTDFDAVHAQYQAHQAFWKEVLEQQPKIRSVIASGNRLANESHWTQGTGEDLRAQFVGVAPRWEGVWSEGEEWGRLLGAVHPEMETFQSLCSECGQKLSEYELVVEKMEPVSRKLHILNNQMDFLDKFETDLVAIGKQLEAIVLSQRKQMQLGVKVNSDLYKLVKGFHHRWNQLKQCVDQRRVAIETAQIQYDPVNLSTTELPVGWKRASTENGTPYFINTRVRDHTQWEHPELSSLYSSLHTQHSLSSYPSPSYPIALKLRVIQRKTQLAFLRTKNCVNVYTAHLSDPTYESTSTSHNLSFYDMTILAIDLFQTVEEEVEKGSSDKSSQFYINRAVEMSTCWIRDVFDVDHKGKVDCVSMLLAAVSLSKGKLDEKYKALFKIASRGEESMDVKGVTSFLENAMMVGQSVSEVPFCSMHVIDACARECFRKHVGVGRLHLQQFVSWLQSEPLPLSWLPILHRLGASERATHDVRCSVCKSPQITGFRYHCVQCANFDMCQNCYWSGSTGKGHDRTKHFMEEYCMPKPADEVNFLKTIRKSFRLKKKVQLDPQQQGKVGGADHAQPGTPMERRWTTSGRGSPSTAKKRSTYVAISIGDNRRTQTLGRDVGASLHPGRRFTVLDDVQSTWKKSDTLRHERTSQYSSPSGSPSRSSWARHSSKPPPTPTHTNNLEDSLSKLSQTSKSLSFRLRSLREKQTSPVPREEGSPGPDTTPDRDAARSPTPEEELRRRNAMLQGRVQLLQEHNLRLENCISQLKLIASLKQSSPRGNFRPLPSQPRGHAAAATVRPPPPLPSRTMQQDTYDVPPSHRNMDTYDVPPSFNDAVYDLPPEELPNRDSDLYDVPGASRRTSSPANLYSVPMSNSKLSPTEQLYSVPTGKKMSMPELYSSPTSKDASELYSVPTSSRRTNQSPDNNNVYDVPPPKPVRSLPIVPMAVLKSNQRGLNRLNYAPFQGGMETYDIPPPKLLSAPPNPNIPPPKLPRRTNTAPTGGTMF